jgi:hypothetical protein
MSTPEAPQPAIIIHSCKCIEDHYLSLACSLENSHGKGGNEQTAVKPIQAQFLIAFEIVFGVFSKDLFSRKYINFMFFLIILIVKKSI